MARELELWNQGCNTAEIAKILKRPEHEIYNTLAHLREERRKIVCLKCREPFASNGNGNRVCETCKSSDEWE